MIFSLIASIISSGTTLFEKTVYNHKRKKYRIFVPLTFFASFFFLVIFMLLAALFYPSLGGVSREALTFWALVALGVMVVVAAVRNMLYYSGFQREGLSEIEPFVAFTPLLTVIIASIFYADERNLAILVLTFIAAAALIGSHIERKHLVVDKGLIPIGGAVVLEAMENNIAKYLLEYYSPLAMYAVRVGLVTLLLFIFVKPNLKKVSRKNLSHLLLIGFLWVVTVILIYYGYQTVGVVYTTLILMLAPVLIVLGSYLILKERKIRKRDILALVVVVGCVIAAQFLG